MGQYSEGGGLSEKVNMLSLADENADKTFPENFQEIIMNKMFTSRKKSLLKKQIGDLKIKSKNGLPVIEEIYEHLEIMRVEKLNHGRYDKGWSLEKKQGGQRGKDGVRLHDEQGMSETTNSEGKKSDNEQQDRDEQGGLDDADAGQGVQVGDEEHDGKDFRMKRLGNNLTQEIRGNLHVHENLPAQLVENLPALLVKNLPACVVKHLPAHLVKNEDFRISTSDNYDQNLTTNPQPTATTNPTTTATTTTNHQPSRP